MRLVIVSAVLAVFGISIDHINGTLETIALFGAAVAALGVVHVKVMRPMGKLIRTINRGVDGVLHIEQWTKQVDERLDRLEESVGLERQAASIERRKASAARATA